MHQRLRPAVKLLQPNDQTVYAQYHPEEKADYSKPWSRMQVFVENIADDDETSNSRKKFDADRREAQALAAARRWSVGWLVHFCSG
jgi:hypothetical protein